MEFVTENLVEIISGALVIAGVIVRLTPTEKDNSVFNLVKKILDTIVPNFDKKGNKHK